MSVTSPDGAQPAPSNPSTMDKLDKLQDKLRTDMDKLKTQIKSALSLRDNDTPAPPRTREAIEAEMDRLRLTNQWAAAGAEADLLLLLLGRTSTAAPSAGGTLPSPLVSGVSFSASAPPPPQPLYTVSESAALAYTTLAQSYMVNYQVTAAHLYIDKALQADDGFMDALFVRAMLELTRHHSSAPTSASASPPASSTPLSAPTIIVSPATASTGVTIEGAAMPATTAFANQPGVTPVKMVYPTGSSAPTTPANTAVSVSAPVPVFMTPVSAVTSTTSTTSSSVPVGPSLSSVLSGPDRVTAQLALSWLNRYRWQENKSWLTLETRKRTPYRFRVLLDLLLSRGRLHELLGQYKEAAGQYGAVLSVCSVELKLEGDVADRVTFAQQRVPRMLLYAGNRADSLKVMRSVLISTPANYTPPMVSALRHAYASLILRGFSASDYTGIATNDGRAKPTSFTQEALFLLALSGQHSLVAMPAVPPSLHWHPFSPISLSHGSSSHAVYLSHSPVPLPLTSTQPLGPGYRTIVSLDFSTSTTQTSLPQDEKERAERESCLTLARAGEYVVMAEMYRNLLSHQLESPQLWYKLCLSLMAARQYNEAYLAITEALNRAPDYVMALLMAARLCINYLDKAKEAVTYAAHALDVTQASTPVSSPLPDNPLAPFKAISNPPTPQSPPPSSGPSSPTSQQSRISNGQPAPKPTAPALPAPPSFSFTSTSSNQLTLTPSLHASLLLSCQLLFAISCSKYAYSVSTFQNRKSLQRRALAVLQLAYKHSPSHHKLLFSLACLYADIREIGLSMSVVRQCLAIDRSHVQSWNLLALLLSAQKKYVEAVRACEGRRGKGCEGLVLTKARLLGEMGQFDEACKCMIELVSGAFIKDEYEMRETKGAVKSRRPVFRQRKGQQPQAPSLQVLNIDDPTLFKADILLLLSHLYAQQYSVTAPADVELLTDAYDCVHKCRAIAPSSLLPTIHAQLASLSLLSNAPSTALHHFESALALDSTHTPSLVGLASLYSQPPPPLTANLVLSYGYLTQALQIDATDHRAWYEMGRVLVAQGRGDEAVDQLMTAAELERTSPIVSFGTVHRRV